MAKSDTTACEVWIRGAWRPLPLAEAHLHHREADKRCPSCHGRVHTTGAYSAVGSVVMTHRRRHDGCPLMPSHYAGTPKRHPAALP